VRPQPGEGAWIIRSQVEQIGRHRDERVQVKRTGAHAVCGAGQGMARGEGVAELVGEAVSAGNADAARVQRHRHHAVEPALGRGGQAAPPGHNAGTGSGVLE
jgi:hypothetical protein